MRECYHKGYEFPEWSLDMLRIGQLSPYARTVVVYHSRGDPQEVVKTLAREREPVNIQMSRCYDMGKLKAAFGYEVGAYSASTKDRLQPHIAIYCKTPLRDYQGRQVDAHVMNAIGIAFDSTNQPDYRYFFPLTSQSWQKLVERMELTWRFIFQSARDHKLKTVYLCDVGGGFFAELLNSSGTYNYGRLKADSLPTVQKEFPDIEVRGLREIFDDCFNPARRSDLEQGLLVNAWDPWSMVGNGNAGDNSLDGKFGRLSAMAVLCWPQTNMLMSYRAV